MKLLQYTWKNSMMKIANSKMAVFVILMIVVSRSYVGAIRQFSVAVDYPSSWCVSSLENKRCIPLTPTS